MSEKGVIYCFQQLSSFFGKSPLKEMGQVHAAIENNPKDGASDLVCFLHEECFVKDTPKQHKTRELGNLHLFQKPEFPHNYIMCCYQVTGLPQLPNITVSLGPCRGES